jgi:ribosome-binding factor A
MVSRSERVRKAIIREVSDLLQTNIKDPRISGLVSVTDVELSPDCRHAKVFVSVFGSEEERESTMQGLASSTGYMRSEIGKRIQMRFTPEISFKIDDSLERGSRVSLIIDKISRGEI